MSGYVPKLIQQTMNKKSGDIVTALDWNTIFNLLIMQGDDTALNLESLYNIIAQNYSDTNVIQHMLDEKIVEIGAGDMPKSIYDSDNNGIVDTAESVIDNAIKTNSIQNNAVTENKLATAVQTKLNKIHSVGFKIDYANATSHTVGTTNNVITLNDSYFFNLGFTPKAVLIFKTQEHGENTGSSYVRERSYHYAAFGYEKFYEYSDHDNEEYEDFGGFAITGAPAVGLTTNLEIFSITTNGINLKKYHSFREYSDGSELENRIDFSGAWCIALG